MIFHSFVVWAVKLSRVDKSRSRKLHFILDSDANGNLATTTNVGLDNLTVKGESNIGSLITGSTMVNGTLNVSDKLTGPTVSDLYNLINSVKTSLEKRAGDLETARASLEKRAGEIESRANTLEKNAGDLKSRVDGHDSTLATCLKNGENLFYTNVDSIFPQEKLLFGLRRIK